MSIFRRCRWRFSLFLVLSLCVLAGVSQGVRGVAEAQAPPPSDDPIRKSLSDSVGCWASGPYKNTEASNDYLVTWGGDAEFVAMPEDHLGVLNSGDDWCAEWDIFLLKHDLVRQGETDERAIAAGRELAETTSWELKEFGLSGNPRPAYFIDFPSYIDHAFGINTEDGSVDKDTPLNDIRYQALTTAIAGNALDGKADFLFPG